MLYASRRRAVKVFACSRVKANAGVSSSPGGVVGWEARQAIELRPSANRRRMNVQTAARWLRASSPRPPAANARWITAVEHARRAPAGAARQLVRWRRHGIIHRPSFYRTWRRPVQTAATNRRGGPSVRLRFRGATACSVGSTEWMRGRCLPEATRQPRLERERGRECRTCWLTSSAVGPRRPREVCAQPA